MTYDLIIIGGGPAGTAAGVYAARKKLNTLLITESFGGQSEVSPEIHNWIGDTNISGQELAQKFENHLKEYEGQSLEIIQGHKAINVSGQTGDFTVTLDNNSEYKSQTVFLAVGSRRRRLDIPGAEEFDQKGLTYCASCDGPMFTGQDVAVIGGGNAGFETAAQLLAYCQSVTLLHRSPDFRADKITVEQVLKDPKMTAITDTDTLEIKGDKFVSGLVYKDKNTGETKDLNVTGIFVEIGLLPNTDLVKDVVNLSDYGSVKVDPKTQRTSTIGIWAAGDCTDGLYHQNNIAAGDAVKALEDIYNYLKLGK